jgi:periplasmic divalent cation tolerance protein
MEPVLLYITAPNREEAISLSRELLGQRLIACANIVDHAISLYHWQGQIEHAPEALIIAKTLESQVERVTERVKALHSYSCPCVVAVPIAGGNPDYIEWLGGEVGQKAAG